MSPLSALITAVLLVSAASGDSRGRGRHTISFRSPDLYPEGLAYDPATQRFLTGSIRHRTIVAVSDSGAAETLISDPDLPPDSAFLGLAVDGHRLLAAVAATSLSALAAYDLRSGRRLFLSVLSSDRLVPNGVAADPAGNAYVTSSAANLIWKVDPDGRASVFSNSSAFRSSPPLDPAADYSSCGLNGVAYVSEGYLLAVQTNTGRIFKVSERDGSAARVPLGGRDLAAADDIAVVRGGAAAFVVSAARAWVVRSEDGWGSAAVSGEIPLEEERFATSLAVVGPGPEERVYAVFGHVREGIDGGSGREVFGIEELRAAEMERDGGDRVWIYGLIGFGLVYFMVWRFQMKRLISNMDKKIN